MDGSRNRRRKRSGRAEAPEQPRWDNLGQPGGRQQRLEGAVVRDEPILTQEKILNHEGLTSRGLAHTLLWPIVQG